VTDVFTGFPVTLKQVSAHLGPKPATLQVQIYEERGLGHRLQARKITGRMWVVERERLNEEAAARGKAPHTEPTCQVCIDAGCPNG
jgi:hypothetical protein